MSKKDYIAIAAILADRRHLHAGASRDTVDRIAEDLCDLFKRDNSRFDTSKFLAAVRS